MGDFRTKLKSKPSLGSDYLPIYFGLGCSRNVLLRQTSVAMRSLRQVAEIHLGSIFAWGKVDAMEIGVKRLLVQITP